ncbi:hypothetical protein [Streptomyces mutabilis]|uniref:hypothetical protein n=1 Tax=Streptomyces mutabilis TaxID=67332 RepID=UPI001146970C|nr:hypothetical protein [Streptomyces mutabilis]
MGVPAGTWLAVGAIMTSGPPWATNKAAGLLLLLAGLALLRYRPRSGRADELVASLFLATSSLRFFLTGACHLSGGTAWKEAAGITGLVFTAVALYAALASKSRTSAPYGAADVAAGPGSQGFRRYVRAPVRRRHRRGALPCEKSSRPVRVPIVRVIAALA